MLCDFAITPQSIQQSEDGSLTASVTEGVAGLLKAILTLNAKHLMVLSDVCDGELSKRLFEISKAPAGESDRKLLSALRKELAELGVRRPPPPTDLADGDAAIASARLDPAAERIIVSPQYKSMDALCWEETKGLDFYSPLFRSQPSPKQGDLKGQLAFLTPILARADFVVLILPYFYVRLDGQSGNWIAGGDMGFSMALAAHWQSTQVAHRRGTKHRLDIRTDRKCVDRKEPGRAPDQKRAMESLLRDFANTNVFLDGSDQSKERRLLAGIFRNGRDDYRWGVNLGHPANSDGTGSNQPASFSSMSREDIAACASIVRSFRHSPLVTT